MPHICVLYAACMYGYGHGHIRLSRMNVQLCKHVGEGRERERDALAKQSEYVAVECGNGLFVMTLIHVLLLLL